MSAFDDLEVCRAILESLRVGLCVVDLQKRIVFWSDGAENITGHRRHEVVGHSCIGQAVLHCDQQGCEFGNEECPLARAMKTSHPVEAVGFLHHKEGHEIPVRVRALPVRNGHGSIIGAVETFEDQEPATNIDHREDSMNLPDCVDAVTGISNRTMMQLHLRETLETFSEVHVPFGVLCFRLEGLDRFRASFGPEAESSLLRVVAHTLEGGLWKTDFVGRWSDDQFLVILNGCSDEAMRSVRERVRRMLSNDAIDWWGERRSLPVSMGEATAEAGDSIESLMERAQRSLDTASAGRVGGQGLGAAQSSGS